MAEAAAPPIDRYISADSIPEIAQARDQVRQQAWETVRTRQEQIAGGQEIDVPLAIDALSTADYVLEAGSDTLEYQNRLSGLRLDCRRLVAEWYRKLKPEYFPASRHFFDAETGDFYSHGLSIRQMTENALRPISDNPEEIGRRVNERVENETPAIIRKFGSFALAQVGIRTISECTDKAVADYREDQASGSQHRGYDGYVPEIEKLMIRDIRFDEATGDRLEEQIGLPGLLINHFVIEGALRRRGVEAGGMDKTDIHGQQLIVRDDLMDFVRLLDDVAVDEWRSELRGMTVFMGEEVPIGSDKNYRAIRPEALKRQEQLKDTADTVANFVLDLAEDKFDRRKAPAHIEEFVKRLLLGAAKKDTALAYQMFDENTAVGLQDVARLEAAGLYEEAYTKMLKVEAAAPGGGYCSGGSCGLESINTYSEKGKELKKNLRAEDSDTIVRDKERSCKCGQKTVIYAYNSDKVNKYCTSCKAFETKKSRIK